MFKKKKIEEIGSDMESNVHLPYLFLGSEAYLIYDASISSSLQRQKPINIDMISNLPDNILHHILSLLSTKTAIRTSILSKRWRYLWTYLPVFFFLIFYDYHYKNRNPSTSYSLLDVLATLLNKSNHHLVEKKRLNILIPQVILDEHKITSLVTSLLGLKVQHLEFFILDTRYLNTSCVLPSGFSASHSLSKLTLKLGGYTLYIPTGIQFPGLKTLNLYYATFASEESVEQFFSGCPILEELSLNYCYWLYIKQITIAIPTLRILSIHFDPYCLKSDDFSKISVKIDVVNLLSLTCISNPSIKFVIVNPLISMVDAYIAFTLKFRTKEYPNYVKYVSHCAIVLLSGLASVKSLTLSKDTIKVPLDANHHFHLLPEFHNLTHLCLHVDSVFAKKPFMQFLLRCPKLEVLVFPLGIYTFMDYDDWTLIPAVPCCFKSSLKKLHISKFDGSECEIQFVEFFLENATILEEFQISLSCWSYSRYNLMNLADLKNRFVGMGSCVIKFR